MRGNKLEKSHILGDLILDNLFVKNKIHQSVCFTRIWDITWKLSDSVKNLVGVTNRISLGKSHDLS